MLLSSEPVAVHNASSFISETSIYTVREIPVDKNRANLKELVEPRAYLLEQYKNQVSL